MAIEKGFSIDEVKFNELMNQQKDRAREASKEKFASVNVSLNDTKGFQIISIMSRLYLLVMMNLKLNQKLSDYKKDGKTELVIIG